MRPVFYVSDGTGITTETIGHSVLAQFQGVQYHAHRIPFVDTPEKARQTAEIIGTVKLTRPQPASSNATSDARTSS